MLPVFDGLYRRSNSVPQLAWANGAGAGESATPVCGVSTWHGKLI